MRIFKAALIGLIFLILSVSTVWFVNWDINIHISEWEWNTRGILICGVGVSFIVSFLVYTFLPEKKKQLYTENEMAQIFDMGRYHVIHGEVENGYDDYLEIINKNRKK